MEGVISKQKGQKKLKRSCNHKYQSKTRMCQRYDEDSENFMYSQDAILMTSQKQQLCNGSSFEREHSGNCMSSGEPKGYEQTPCGKRGYPPTKESSLEPF